MNTLIVGITMISFILVSKEETEWLRILQLVIFGAANSLQYSVMNSITLKDLYQAGTNSGNSLFSTVQILAMSYGLATAGTLLSTFHQNLAVQADSTLQAFHLTFMCMGAITRLSTFIFLQLSKVS